MELLWLTAEKPGGSVAMQDAEAYPSHGDVGEQQDPGQDTEHSEQDASRHSPMLGVVPPSIRPAHSSMRPAPGMTTRVRAPEPGSQTLPLRSPGALGLEQGQ